MAKKTAKKQPKAKATKGKAPSKAVQKKNMRGATAQFKKLAGVKGGEEK